MNSTSLHVEPLQGLQELAQWVGWKYEGFRSDGSRDKRPYFNLNGTSHLAKTNDPDTWMPYEVAARSAEEFGWDGVGFVLTENDPYTGGDLDKCLINGVLTPEAQDIIDTLKSYTETSPSGTGVRVFVRGRIPDGIRNRKNGIEIYNKSRFLTITGNRLNDYELSDRQDELEAVCRKYLGNKSEQRVALPQSPIASTLSDNEVIDLLKREGGKAAALFAGDTTGYPSHSEADQALANKVAFYTKDPEQIDRVFQRSGLHRDKWNRRDYSTSTINNALRTVTEQYEKPRAKPQSGQKKRTTTQAPPCDLTEHGDAIRIADRYGRDLLFTLDTGKWYRWRGRCFENVNRAEVENIVRREMERLLSEPGTKDPVQREAIRKHAVRSLNQHKIKQITELLRSTPVNRADGVNVPLTRSRTEPIPVYSEVLDSHGGLLGTPSGPVDLVRGELIEPRRELLITLSTSTTPDFESDCPLWNNLINLVADVSGGGESLAGWIQKMCGYFLTGSSDEQSFFILWGRGCNGKSTFINAISDILGDYTQAISQQTLMVHKGQAGEARPDLAKLRGARFVPAVESAEQGRLDEITVKQLTGGDLVVARALYQDEVQFRFAGKIVLATNNRPTIREYTPAMWRRIKLVPFVNQIADPDPHYGRRLQQEYPAILAWLIEGARRWYEEGLGTHPVVDIATANYADEMDNLAPFFEECCEVEPNQRDWYEPTAAIFSRYEKWCEDIGVEPVVKANGLGRYITQKFGLESVHKWGVGKVRIGIRLVDKPPPAEQKELA